MQLLNNLFYFNNCNGYVCLLYFYRICLLYFFLKHVSRYIFICILTSYIVFPPGGGGGVLRFGSDGGVPLKPPNPYLSLRPFKGHFGGKGYPLLRVFSQENCVFVYFSDEKGENIYSIYSKITKVGGMFKVFQLKTIPYV